MKPVRTLVALALLCSLATPVLAKNLVIQGGNTSASGEILIQGSGTATICTVPATAGVTVNALALDPGCITVAPASAVTGPNGCASFTVSCATNSCIGRVKYTANTFPDLVGMYRCDFSGVPSVVPSVGTWGLLAMTSLLFGLAAITYYRRRRA